MRYEDVSKKRKKSIHNPPEVTGSLISREEVLAKTGLPEGTFDDCVDRHLIPRTIRVSGEGSGRAGAHYMCRTGHILYCNLVKQVLDAGGNYDQAALRIMLERLPFPRHEEGGTWIGRALIEYITRRYGDKVTVGELRREARSPRLTAKNITNRAHIPIGLPNSEVHERDSRALTSEARRFATTRNANSGMDRAKSVRAGFARAFMGKPDPGIPDISALRFVDVVKGASPEAMHQAYHMAARSFANGKLVQRVLSEALRVVPHGEIFYSDAETVESMLGQPGGLFKGVSRTHAIIPGVVLVCLLKLTGNLTGNEEQAMLALFGMPEPERVYEKNSNLRELEHIVDAATVSTLAGVMQEWTGSEVNVG
jgi:hypothetical protein